MSAVISAPKESFNTGYRVVILEWKKDKKNTIHTENKIDRVYLDTTRKQLMTIAQLLTSSELCI